MTPSWLCSFAAGCGEIHARANECCMCLGYGADTEGNFCECPTGAAMAKAEEEGFAYVREFPAAAVFSADALADRGMTGEERIK